MTNFLVRIDLHDLARNGHVQEDSFLNLSTRQAMEEYWRNSMGIPQTPKAQQKVSTHRKWKKSPSYDDTDMEQYLKIRTTN